MNIAIELSKRIATVFNTDVKMDDQNDLLLSEALQPPLSMEMDCVRVRELSSAFIYCNCMASPP